MWALFNTPAMFPFAVATVILLILLLVEVLGFFFGGMSGFLDNLLPDSLVDADFDADLNTEMDAGTDMSMGLRLLDWLYVGRIPTMILLILLIASFAICGFLVQQLSMAFLGHYLSPWLASVDALVLSFPVLRLFAGLLYPILPKDETTAVSGASLIGHQATIVLGYASINSPAQAKLVDAHGQTHYVMVEPDPAHVTDISAPQSQDSRVMLDVNEGANDRNSASTELATVRYEEGDKLVITQKVGERYLVKKLG